MFPDDIIKKVYSIPFNIRMCFITTFFAGILIHMYMFTNKFANHDDVLGTFYYGDGYTSGRWMLSILGESVKKLFGNYSMPWLLGVISIFFLAVSASFIVEILEIDSKVSSAIIGILLVAFPTITSTFLYMYTSCYYCFAILLCIISVWALKKYQKGYIAGSFLIAMALGIYQAYFGFATTLVILVLMEFILNKEAEQMKIVKFIGKAVTMLALGIILYFVFNKLFLKLNELSLNTYKSLDKMGQMTGKQLLNAIVQAYFKFFNVANTDYFGISYNGLLRKSILITFIITMILIVMCIFAQIKKRMRNIVLLISCFVLLPLSINIIYVMCANAGADEVHGLMIYPYIFVFYIPLFLVEIIRTKHLYLFNRKSVICVYWVVTILLVNAIFCYTHYANEVYFKMQLNHDKMEAYFDTLVMEIKMVDGYNVDMPIAFIGEIADKSLPCEEEFSNLEGCTGLHSISQAVNDYGREYYLFHYLGYTYENSLDEENIAINSEVIKMNNYPNENSIKVINGIIVVKLSGEDDE